MLLLVFFCCFSSKCTSRQELGGGEEGDPVQGDPTVAGCDLGYGWFDISVFEALGLSSGVVES